MGHSLENLTFAATRAVGTAEYDRLNGLAISERMCVGM